jgi:hypothetical protein
MLDVHLADVPFHVGGLEKDIDAVLDAMLINGVYVIDPHRHPYAFVV